MMSFTLLCCLLFGLHEVIAKPSADLATFQRLMEKQDRIFKTREDFIQHYKIFRNFAVKKKTKEKMRRMKTALASINKLRKFGSILNVTRIDHLEVGFCGGSPRPGTIDRAVVSPFPVVIANGASITLDFKTTLAKTIPEDTIVSVKIKKKETWFPNIPVPCIEYKGFYIGSCEYPLDFLLHLASPVLCPTYFPPGQECQLPLLPGHYGGNQPLVVGPFHSIPRVVADLLAAGEYDTEATIRTKEGSLVACVYAKVQLRGPDAHTLP